MKRKLFALVALWAVVPILWADVLSTSQLKTTGGGGASGITSGTTQLAGFVDGDILYNNGGVAGGFQGYNDSGAGNATFLIRKTPGASQYALEVSNGTVAQGIACFFDNVTCAVAIVDGGAVRGIDGAASSPAYSFTSATNTGLYLFSSQIAFSVGASVPAVIAGSALRVRSDATLGFASTTGFAADDVFLSRSAAAVLQIGAANAASPVNQSLRAQGSRGGTDTNVAGGSLTVYSGLGTGTATPSELIFQTGVVQASGTTQHTLTDAAKITAGGLQNTKGDKFLTADHTNATATPTNLTDLTVTVVSGRKYTFKLILMCSQSVAADGIRVDFEGGTATATNFRAHVLIYDGTTIDTHTAVTALATDVTSTDVGTTVLVEVWGSFEPSAAGTFIPRVGLEAASTGTITTARGSHLSVWDMP